MIALIWSLFELSDMAFGLLLSLEPELLLLSGGALADAWRVRAKSFAEDVHTEGLLTPSDWRLGRILACIAAFSMTCGII